jgi:hypothetical protein
MRLKITFLLLIILTLISPPFIFAQIIHFGREIRVSLALILILLLFLQISKFKFIDMFIFILLAIFILLNFIYKNHQDNFFSFFFTILIVILLFRLLRSNKSSYNIFLNLWLYFSFIISVGAIISFLIHQFTNLNFDILNFQTLFFDLNSAYKVSIFGLTLSKNYQFGEIVRVCSFFVEPIYAGFFFILNILLAKINSNLVSKKFLIANILAGLLTFSIAFYLVFAILMIFFRKRNITYIFAILTLIFLFFITLYQPDVINDYFTFFLDHSSFYDRIVREKNGIVILRELSFLNILFGNGMNSYASIKDDYLININISSGYLNILFDFGIVFSFFILILLILSFIKNPTLTLICMLYLFVLPIFKFYYVWHLIILCGLACNNKFSLKKINNKKII